MQDKIEFSGSALNKACDEYVERRFPEEKAQNPFLPETALKEKLRLEFREAVIPEELVNNLVQGLKIIKTESSNYLDAEMCRHVEEELERTEQALSQGDESAFSQVTIAEVVSFSTKALEGISLMGKKKYAEGEYGASTALFAVLTTLNPAVADFWYRLGISLQEAGDLEKSVRAYQAAVDLDPNLIGGWIFSAECLIDLGQKEKADERLDRAKTLIDEHLAEDKWLETISILKGKR